MDDFSRPGIDDLIVRSLQGRADFEEEERLRQWREASHENETHYTSTARLWELTGVGNPFPEAGDPPGVEALLRAVSRDEEPAATGRSTLPGRRTHRRLVKVGIGALAASVAALGFGLGTFFEGRGMPATLRGGEIVTGAGELTTVTFSDGSSVRLGPKSRLYLDQEDGDVVARLEGRAFFGVERDESRRFRVVTDYGEATVFGTRFEVRSEEEEFRVLVVEGRVQVSTTGSPVDLTEGEMSLSRNGAPPDESKVEDVYPYLDWMGNALVLQRTPLVRALREIERRFDVHAVLEDPELGSMTVTAAFTDQSVESIFLVLCETMGARCAFDGDSVRIRQGLSDGPSDR